MTITQLNYFLGVVTHRSFTRAAEALFVSQSTLSKAVQNLEEELHVELVDRKEKTFKLTQEGEVFRIYAEKIVRNFNIQTQELKERLKSIDRSLDIGIPPTAGTAYFFTAVRKFKKAFPNVNMNLVEVPSKGIVEMLNQGDLELGVVLEPFEDDNFIIKRAFESQVCVVANENNPLAQKKMVSFADLKNEKIVMISKTFMFYNQVMERFHNAGVEPNIVFVTAQWDFMLQLVANNEGICFLPMELINNSNYPQVKALKIIEPEFPWILSLVYRKDKFVTEPMLDFINLALEK